MEKARLSSHRKRSFKGQRAIIACTSCRDLKKACKNVKRQRCQRCTRTNKRCIFRRVGDDTTPRSGSLSPTVEPNSATNPPSESPSLAFEINWTLPSSSEQSDDSRINGDRTNHNLCGSIPSTLNVNAQVPGPSISSPPFIYQQSPFLFDPSAEQPIFGNTYLYNHPVAQTRFAQLQAPPHELGIIHPSYFFRSEFNPSPLSHSNVQTLPTAPTMPSVPHSNYGNTPSSTSFLAITGNNSEYISMPTPTNSPIEHFDRSNIGSYDQPLQPPKFNYRRDYSTDDEFFTLY